MNKILLPVLLLFVFQAMGQVAPDKYYIQFTDKDNSPYTLDQPEDFLTQRAIDRRTKQGIAIDDKDLPVNPQYLQGVSDQGAQLLNATRWFNGVTIYTTNSTVLDNILDLPYVQGVLSLKDRDPGIEKSYFLNESIDQYASIEKSKSSSSFDYGWADYQINQINGAVLHDQGYRGEGMVIAVLDGGFVGADVHPLFDSIWDNNKVLGTKSFVNIGGTVFTESQHGKSVLSCMAANSPGVMIGTAPKASYWLLHSEDVKSENIIEEYNWVSAAEFADSVGADIINSSLSYRDFDDPQWDHTYEDLDGNTAVGTIGADIAASKGILVCNSAGNSGNSGFPWNGAPADGDSVMSVGALTVEDTRAGFSSIGPTADGRIRPVTMALGQGATVAEGNSGVTWGNGTSFASPIIAGISACLWQANPNMKVMDLFEAIKESGSMAENPDNLMGWGIPDFELANSILTTVENPVDRQEDIVSAWPNPVSDVLVLQINQNYIKELEITMHSTGGQLIYRKELSNSEQAQQLNINMKQFPDGMYILKVLSAEGFDVERIVKQ